MYCELYEYYLFLHELLCSWKIPETAWRAMHISQVTHEFWCFWIPVRGTAWRYIPNR